MGKFPNLRGYLISWLCYSRNSRKLHECEKLVCIGLLWCAYTISGI